MTALFRHEGDTIDYTPPADVAAGTVVVLNGIVGFANNAIAANAKGCLQISGVALMPISAALKATTPGLGIKAMWDDTNDELVAHAGSAPTLYIAEAVDTVADTVWVFLNTPG